MRDRIAALLSPAGARVGLSPAEAKVAALVAADPGRIVAGNLAAVASAAGVSEPTVIRFCRRLGLAGFSDLRLALARAEGGGHPVREVSLDLPPAEVAGAACEAAIAALATLRSGLDPAAMQRAAALLLEASQVEIWGEGEVGPVAEAVGQRLAGLCRGMAVRTDARMQAVAAAGLEAGAVLLCVSAAPALAVSVVTGGARIIALGPAAQGATVVLGGALPQGAGLASPMARRVALLALGEALALTVHQMAPPAARERHARMAAALASTPPR